MIIISGVKRRDKDEGEISPIVYDNYLRSDKDKDEGGIPPIVDDNH